VVEETRMTISRKLAQCLLVATAACVTGCVDKDSLKLLEDSLALTQQEVGELKTQVEALQNQQALAEFLQDADRTVYLTPGSTGYSVIRCDLGFLTVSLDNIQTYANGSRVTLQLGNLTNATINGAKASLEWGRTNEKGLPRLDAASRSREVTINRSLRPGAWTTVPVVLEGVPPSELGFVRVKSITHTGISLLR
jgi:hypothetical protein